jgi:hypothetical protein
MDPPWQPPAPPVLVTENVVALENVTVIVSVFEPVPEAKDPIVPLPVMGVPAVLLNELINVKGVSCVFPVARHQLMAVFTIELHSKPVR